VEDMEETVYSVTVDEGRTSGASLSPGMEEACRGAEVVATREEEVTREQFQQLVDGGVIRIPKTKPGRVRSSLDDCASLETVCAFRGRGCWRWEYAGNAFSIHHLNADVICVDCCADQPWTEGCQCDAIRSATDLSKCGKNQQDNSRSYSCARGTAGWLLSGRLLPLLWLLPAGGWSANGAVRWRVPGDQGGVRQYVRSCGCRW
jgi:hypothetical protein